MIVLRLSRILGEKKLSMADLARMTGINNNGVSDLYHERTFSIRFDTLDRMCKALDCSVADLLEYIPDNETEQNNKGSAEKGDDKPVKKRGLFGF
jgi:Predicted transcriptional regulator